jgi:hypothetical protein
MLDDIAADEIEIAAEAAEPIPASRPIPKLKLIRTACLECVDGEDEVRRCAFFACPLWPFRMGRNPFPLSEAQVAQRAKAAEKSPLALSGPPDSPHTPRAGRPPDFRGPNGPSAHLERPTLDQLRAWAGRNLPMESVASPDPRGMTGEELAALGCTNRSPAKAIRRYEREIERPISWHPRL